MTKTDGIIQVVQEVADAFQVFQPRGPGAGNRVTNEALLVINRQTSEELGAGIVQRVLCSNAKQSVDFYVEDEATVIEVEFSLSNPYPCLEKDAFKVLLAKDAGCAIETLVLIGDPGCGRRLSAPAPQAIIEWMARQHGVSVRVVELAGVAPLGKRRSATAIQDVS